MVLIGDRRGFLTGGLYSPSSAELLKDDVKGGGMSARGKIFQIASMKASDLRDWNRDYRNQDREKRMSDQSPIRILSVVIIRF